MVILLALLILIVLLLVFGIIHVIRQLRKNDFDSVVSLLEKVLNVTVILIAIAYSISVVVFAISIIYSEIVLILFVKTLIFALLLFKIYVNTKKLLLNLKTQNIFVINNVDYIQTIGYSFAYIALAELISGLAIQAFFFVSQISLNFELSFDFTVLIYLIVGILLIVLSKIFYLAIKIHEENQLTI